MKNIFLIMIGGLLCYNTWGQCSPLNVSTDPQNPFNDKVGQNVQFFSHLNNFDWQTSYYTINGYVAPALNSPFEENNNSITFNKLSTNSGIKDYYVEDGWELLNENVTSSSSSLTNPTDIVYFTFYNKYSSVIRVLFAMEETWFPFQSVSVELKLGDPNINAMFHPMGNIGQALDKASSEAVIVSVPMAANEYYFMIADFPVEYDPCVCFKNNLSKINASFELVNEQAINWLGNLSIDNSMVNLVSDAENSSRGELSFAGTSSIDDDITKGALIFRSIDNLMDKYEDLETMTVNYDKKIEKIQKAKIALSFIATANTVTRTAIGSSVVATPTPEATNAAAELINDNKATFKAFKATADIAKGLSPLTDFFSYQARAEKSEPDQTINKFGNASINFGTLNIDRTISIRQKQSTGFSMAIPGGAGTTPIINSNFYPKYDNVLGRIAVLETPEVRIANDEVKLVNGKRLYTKRIAFDATTLAYLFNPAAGVNKDETVIFATLEVVGVKSKYLTLSKEKSYNINLDNIEETEEKVVFSSEFVPLSCLSDLSMELAYAGDVIISDDSDITITEVNIKLVIAYSFDQIGRSGTKNRAVQIITYPMEIKKVSFEATQAPISNNGEPIPAVLELNTNQNFTTNTTLFAWEKVVINGNLTAAADVNIKIIAPEIVIATNINIDSNIDLQQDFYPKECLPLEPVGQTKVTNFCNSLAYQANKAKSSSPINETPVFEKPTVPIVFQAYPNPFTNTFNIVFELENESTTSLMVFDALGRVVETVIMNDNLSIGKHQYQIDGSRLQSGLYYVRLQTNDNVQTIKIIKQ